MRAKSTASGVDQEGSTARTGARRDATDASDSSPYRGEDRCPHARIVETTCDWRAPNYLTDAGAVGAVVIVRPREFECDQCGKGGRPTGRAEACFPRCTRPLCDCLSEADRLAIEARPFWNIELPREMAYADESDRRAYVACATRSVPSSVVLAVDPSWSTPKTDSVAAALPVSERREGTNG